jgi:acetyl esterase/lipase
VVSIDYRLAPEHRFPAAIDDARSAVRYIGSHAADFGIDERRLGVCGDSAGGTLAAVTCRSLAKSQPIALQVLICPILDYAMSTPSWRELGGGYLIEAGTLAHDLAHCLPPGLDPAAPEVSPLRAADFSGLPRTLIHTAEFDPLRDEGREYFERISRAGCTASHTCHPGMIHLFYGLKGVIPSAGPAFAKIGAEIQAAFAGAAVT